MVSKNTNNKPSSDKELKKELKDKNGNYIPTNTNHLTKLSYKTFNGHKLTPKEAKFIDFYVETGNGRQSVLEAGYLTKAPGQYSQCLLSKKYVSEEISYRLQKLEDEKIASAEEILKYFTGVMRGEIKDQFGLDTPLSERTKAAQELAKRKIDIANRVAAVANQADNNSVTIKLDWSGMMEGDVSEKEENEYGKEDDE